MTCDTAGGTRSRTSVFVRVALVATAFGAAASAFGADLYWVGASGANWSGSNWATSSGGTGGAWVAGSDAIFSGSSKFIVNVDSDVTAGIVKMSGTGYDEINGSGVLRANGIWKMDRRLHYVNVPTLYIGSDGIGAKDQDWRIDLGGNAKTIYATADFEIFGPKSPRSNELYDWSVKLVSSTTFNTQGHTITWTGGANADSGAALVKEGAGALVMNPWGAQLNIPITINEGAFVMGKSLELGSSVSFAANTTFGVQYNDNALGALSSPAITIAGPLAVDFPSGVPGGSYAILTITGSGTFSSADLANLSTSAANVTLELSADEKSIVAVKAADLYWVGASGASWSGSNWATTSGGTGGAWISGRDAIFDGSSKFTVAVDSDVTAGVVKMSGTGYDEINGSGVLRADGIWKMDRKLHNVNVPTLYIGSDGIGAKDQDWRIDLGGGDKTVYATADFEIFGPQSPRSNELYDWSVKLVSSTTFNTQGHTITWMGGANADSAAALVKEGAGALVMNPWGAQLNIPITINGGAFVMGKPLTLGSSVSFAANTTFGVQYNDGAVASLSSPAIAIAGPLTVEFPDGVPDAQYPILAITGSGTFSAADVAKLTTSASGVSFELSADEKSIVAVVGTGGRGFWTGANGTSLDDPLNWNDGNVPVGYPAYITTASALTLTHNEGGTFAPSAIVFSGIGLVTINGTGSLEGITSIENHSSQRHVFNVPVKGDSITFCNESQCCAFPGGIEVETPSFTGGTDKNSRRLGGSWHITGNSWTPLENNWVGHGYANTAVVIDGELLNPEKLWIAGDGCVTAATMKVTTPQYAVQEIYGRLVVTGACEIGKPSSGDPTLVKTHHDTETLIFGSLTYNAEGSWSWVNARNLVVGRGGIGFGSNTAAHFKMRFDNNPTIYALDADGFEFKAPDSEGPAYAIKTGNTLTIDTTRFESSPAEGVTVTINGKIMSTGTYVAANALNGGIAVTGVGKVVFNSVSDFSGGLTIDDSATVEVNTNCVPGTGAVTVKSGATLAVPSSGTVTLGGALTIESGAVLAFNFTDKTAAPVLVATSATLPAAVEVKISSANELRPMGGEYVLTSGIDFTDVGVALTADSTDWAKGVSVDAGGNLVLAVKPRGTRIIFR